MSKFTAYANGTQIPVPATLPLGMVAYFYGGKQPRLILSPTCDFSRDRIEVEVSGMREARRIVDGAHARPWNF